MSCPARLAILYTLLAVTSSTPVAPRDGSIAELIEEGMDSMEDAVVQDVTRQVFPGHHGTDQNPTATEESPSATATLDDVGILHVDSAEDSDLEPRQVFPTALPALFCPNPPLTVRVTVFETATVTLNVRTMLPSVASLISNVVSLFPTVPTLPTRLPRQLYSDLATPGSTDTSPIPTSELLAQQQQQEQQQQQQDEGWERSMGLNQEIRSDEDDVIVKREPGGLDIFNNEDIIAAPSDSPMPMEPVPPAPPIIDTSATSSSSSSVTDFFASSSTLSPSPSPSSAIEGACTTTVTGPLSNPCKGAAHMTYYPSTVTSYSSIDCGACTDVRVIQRVRGCPVMTAKPSATATDPYTWTSTVCADTASSSTGFAGFTETGSQPSSTSLSVSSASEMMLTSPPAPAQQTEAGLSATTSASASSDTSVLVASFATPADL